MYHIIRGNWVWSIEIWILFGTFLEIEKYCKIKSLLAYSLRWGHRNSHHLTCLFRNPYAAQEATVRTGHGTTDWFQVGKGVCQGCILSPCLFNLYAEYIMRNAGLEEAQGRIKIAGRNINNLRYADDTTLMEENEEELTASWWKWKRRVKKLA